jgi:ATP phosphoribosyltransferase regulatory subunit
MDAHHLSKADENTTVNRLCYMGTVLRTRSEQQGGSRSPVQVGAELFGHAGIESDFEIISLMLETLHSLDVTDLVLDLGHVGIANGLADHVSLNAQQKEDYFNMLARKSLPEIKSWVDDEGFSVSKSEMLRALPLLSGSTDVIETAQNSLKAAGKTVADALQHLENISDLITSHFPNIQLHIDLAEMRGYAYHTGILYTAYLPDHGSSIAHGGRYDGIGEAFGNSRPAIGFSTDLRTLANLSFGTTELMNSLGVNGILAPYTLNKELDLVIEQLRARGEQVIRQLDENSTLTVQQQGCNRVIEKQEDDWVVVEAT